VSLNMLLYHEVNFSLLIINDHECTEQNNLLQSNLNFGCGISFTKMQTLNCYICWILLVLGIQAFTKILCWIRAKESHFITHAAFIEALFNLQVCTNISELRNKVYSSKSATDPYISRNSEYIALETFLFLDFKTESLLQFFFYIYLS
jgi:hypothetical protein